MKAVCTNLGESLDYGTNNENITVGKSYEVLYQESTYVIDSSYRFDSPHPPKSIFVTLYTITNDKGETIRYNSELFATVDEWRESQMEKIGI